MSFVDSIKKHQASQEMNTLEQREQKINSFMDAVKEYKANPESASQEQKSIANQVGSHSLLDEQVFNSVRDQIMPPGQMKKDLNMIGELYINGELNFNREDKTITIAANNAGVLRAFPIEERQNVETIDKAAQKAVDRLTAANTLVYARSHGLYDQEGKLKSEIEQNQSMFSEKTFDYLSKKMNELDQRMSHDQKQDMESKRSYNFNHKNIHDIKDRSAVHVVDNMIKQTQKQEMNMEVA